MISDVRSFLKLRILEVNSKFKEHDDAFNSENIPSTLLDKSFFIEYGTPVFEQGETHSQDTIPVTVYLFFKGYRKPQEALDDAMDLADLVRLNVVSRDKLAAPYLNIIALTLEPSPLSDSNDNSIIIKIDFDFIKINTIC